MYPHRWGYRVPGRGSGPAVALAPGTGLRLSLLASGHGIRHRATGSPEGRSRLPAVRQLPNAAVPGDVPHRWGYPLPGRGWRLPLFVATAPKLKAFYAGLPFGCPLAVSLTFANNRKQKGELMTDRILRKPEVLEMVGLRSTALYEAISEGRFPKPIQLTKRSVGWLESEVQEWIKEQAEKRQGAA